MAVFACKATLALSHRHRHDLMMNSINRSLIERRNPSSLPQLSFSLYSSPIISFLLSGTKSYFFTSDTIHAFQGDKNLSKILLKCPFQLKMSIQLICTLLEMEEGKIIMAQVMVNSEPIGWLIMADLKLAKFIVKDQPDAVMLDEDESGLDEAFVINCLRAAPFQLL